MKIFSIVGARPNFIKLDKELTQTIVHTGQHTDYEMSTVFFKELNLPKPKYNLACDGKDLGKMIDKLRILFYKEKPDVIQVFGDTNSSLAGALAAAYCGIPLVHVEAGLRSYAVTPEEVNRKIIDHLAKINFCPTSYAELNLNKEGIKENVFTVGDPMFDSLGKFLPFPKGKDYKKYNLLTVHRNFNSDDGKILKDIIKAVGDSGEKTIFPIHPRTDKNLKRFKIKLPSNIKPTLPLSYKNFLRLIADAKKIITDSGGAQKEAYWMNVPVIILRNETEWIDIINKRAGILVGADYDKILDAIKNFEGALNPPPSFGAKKLIREYIYKYA